MSPPRPYRLLLHLFRVCHLFLVRQAWVGSSNFLRGIRDTILDCSEIQYWIASRRKIWTVYDIQYNYSIHYNYNIQYTVYNTQYTVYTVFTIYSMVQIYSIQYTIHSIQYTIHSIQYTRSLWRLAEGWRD